jgi:hypothetical protein
MSQDISTTVASLTGYVKRQAKMHIHVHPWLVHAAYGLEEKGFSG